MPILTLVVPTLKSDSLQWAMQGKSLARQLLCMRGDSLPPSFFLPSSVLLVWHINWFPEPMRWLSLVHVQLGACCKGAVELLSWETSSFCVFELP